jgi:hypothetical protein
MNKMTQSPLFNLIINQEKQLLDRTDPIELLCELLDDDFIEFGSSSTIYDKAEEVRWLASPDQSIRTGTQFKAKQLSTDVILLTYISCIKDHESSEIKRALRSSIWRKAGEQWRMIFHQGTPCTGS